MGKKTRQILPNIKIIIADDSDDDYKNINIQSIQAMERSYEKKELKFNSYQLRLKLLSEDISPNNIDNWVSSFMSVQREPLTF